MRVDKNLEEVISPFKKLGRVLKAKASIQILIDAEKRKEGQGKGLETQLPLPVNDEWFVTS